MKMCDKLRQLFVTPSGAAAYIDVKHVHLNEGVMRGRAEYGGVKYKVVARNSGGWWEIEQ